MSSSKVRTRVVETKLGSGPRVPIPPLQNTTMPPLQATTTLDPGIVPVVETPRLQEEEVHHIAASWIQRLFLAHRTPPERTVFVQRRVAATMIQRLWRDTYERASIAFRRYAVHQDTDVGSFKQWMAEHTVEKELGPVSHAEFGDVYWGPKSGRLEMLFALAAPYDGEIDDEEMEWDAMMMRDTEYRVRDALHHVHHMLLEQNGEDAGGIPAFVANFDRDGDNMLTPDEVHELFTALRLECLLEEPRVGVTRNFLARYFQEVNDHPAAFLFT